MASLTTAVKHIEEFVNSSSSQSKQDACVDAIANLLRNDVLTMESLVREMDMYLTTTDSIIRARGILLLAELLTRLASKPLDHMSISTLNLFFTERLADWKALRGALVGCLALMKRKDGSGTICGDEARAVALSFMQNIQVQSLGQHDRKLCFDLLGYLVDRYPDAVVKLGDESDDFLYAICEAIDGERDPQCLLPAFHIVEGLARVFPDSSGPLSSFAEDIFDILGSYFPIHFTHPKGEDDVKKDDLSKALMLAFASTPLYEPFAVPLLLEKLSSSLSSAKVESLKYLSYCTVKYGADRMLKHAEAIWTSLKASVFTSEPSISSLGPESVNSMGYQDSEIAAEALILLEKIIQQNNDFCLSLIVNDEELNTTINSITNFKVYDNIPPQSKQRLYAVGRILHVSSRVSVASCNTVFESFFPRLLKALEILVENDISHLERDNVLSGRPNFGSLYLCIELLAACRSLVVGSDKPNSVAVSGCETWCNMLNSHCDLLVRAFSSALVTSMNGRSSMEPYCVSGVQGLQILATFPGSFLPVSSCIFENILIQMMSIIVLEFDNKFLWRLVLKSLVHIGLFIEKSHDSFKTTIFDTIVVEKIIAMISSNETTMPLSLKVEALSDIGMTNVDFMRRIVQGLNKAIFTSLSEFSVHGDSKSAEFVAQLLECYSEKVLPWFQNIGGFSEVPLHFAVNIWDEIKDGMPCSSLQQKRLLEATMKAMEQTVGCCSVVGQSTVLDKAFSILSSSNTFRSKKPLSNSSLIKCEGHAESVNSFSPRDEWIISLFASVIIALRPETPIKDVEVILELFIATLLWGHVSSAQALGSLLNKLPLKGNPVLVPKHCSLEEAMNVVFTSDLWMSYGVGHLTKFFHIDDTNQKCFSSLSISSVNSWSVHIHAIVGLAWMGKGLLMRGHEKVKDAVMPFLSLLMSSDNMPFLPGKFESHEDGKEPELLQLMRSAADSFHIMMSDSEDCLNRRYHATVRPLYKQRFFSIVMPILLSSVKKSDSSVTRSMLYRALAHVVSDTPLSAILVETKELIPSMLEGLSLLRDDVLNRDILYNLLLVLSGILTDKNGQEAVVENAHIIVRCLNELIPYPHMTLIRETGIQCLMAMSELPHARIYPMRTQVLLAISKSLDDPKRIVRQAAVRCRQAWFIPKKPRQPWDHCAQRCELRSFRQALDWMII